MDSLIYKVSLLRIKCEQEINFNLDEQKKIIEKYDDQENNYFIDVVYKDNIYVIKDNFDFYWYMKKTKQKFINIRINLKNKEQIVNSVLYKLIHEKLNPILTSVLYYEIIQVGNISQLELGIKINKTQGDISNKLRLLTLPINIQEAILVNKIKERHGRAILKLKVFPNFEENANVVLFKIIKEKLNVNQTEDLVDQILGKTVGSKESLNIKKVKSRKQYNSAETGMIVDKIDKEIQKTLKTINDIFPKLEVELQQGIDKKDYVFLLKLKGINNGKNNSNN